MYEIVPVAILSNKFPKSDLQMTYKEPTRAWISAPSIVEPGEKFDIRASILGVDGYPAQDFQGVLEVSDNSGIHGLPEELKFQSHHGGTLVISDCSVPQTSIARFKVSRPGGHYPSGRCHPIWARPDPDYRLYWGDLHVHSKLGRCGIPYLPKSPDYGYWFASDILGHDFCAMADHGSKMDDDGWSEIKCSTKRWHRPGDFNPVLGFEGDYDGEDGGHFNLYFPGFSGDYMSFKTEDGGSLDSMFDFARDRDALAICHHTSRAVRGRDFSKSHFGGLDVEPVMEIYSQWGSSEEYCSSRPTIEGRHPEKSHYYRYALKHGFPLGVIGGSDSHCTTPGGPVPMAYPQWGGKQLFPYPGGVAAIFAPQLTTESLFNALRSRRCYATTLEEILLWTEIEGQPMGSDVESKQVDLNILVACTHGPLIEVEIVKNGETVERFDRYRGETGFNSQKDKFQMTWHDQDFEKESSYYVRATQFDGDIAWSSPIWVRSD